MRDYKELVGKLRRISECEFDGKPWETVKEAADAIEELYEELMEMELKMLTCCCFDEPPKEG